MAAEGVCGASSPSPEMSPACASPGTMASTDDPSAIEAGTSAASSSSPGRGGAGSPWQRWRGRREAEADVAASRRADEAIKEFYDRMAEASEAQRARRHQFGFRAGAPKLNREELYLNPELRREAEASSRAFLSARLTASVPAPAASPDGADELRGVVAMQHFLELDLADAAPGIAVGHRLSEDEYLLGSESLRDVSEQMTLDAPRGVFVVDGERIDFAAELEASGINLEEEPLEVEQLKEACAERLALAVKRSLQAAFEDGAPPRQLVRATTAILSQSGLAGVERAARAALPRGAPQLVAGGGEQDVRFELWREDLEAADSPPERRPRPAWRLRLAVHRHGFGVVQAIPEDAEADAQLLECAEGSTMRRSADARLQVVEGGRGARGDAGNEDQEVHLRVEVLSLENEIVLLGPNGARLPLPGAPPPPRAVAPPFADMQPKDSRLGRRAYLKAIALNAAHLAVAIPMGVVAGLGARCGRVVVAVAGHFVAWAGLWQSRAGPGDRDDEERSFLQDACHPTVVELPEKKL